MKRKNVKWLVLGLLSISLGTLIAVLSLPDDLSSPGNLRFSALVLSSGLLIIPFYRARKSFEYALKAENVLFLGLVYWILLDPIQGTYPLSEVSDRGIIGSFLAIGLTGAGIWVGVSGRRWRLPHAFLSAATDDISQRNILRISIVFFILGMSNFVYSTNFDLIKMFGYLGGNRWSAPWSRGQFGDWGAFLDHMQYFGYLLPCLAAIYAARKGKKSLTVFILYLLAVIMVLFLAQGGGRRIIGVTVGSGLVAWMLMNPEIKFKRLVVIISSTALLLMAMQVMLETRGRGLKAYEGNIPLFQQYKHIHVDDNFLRLSQVIDIIPDQVPFVYEKQIIYALVRPVPRVFWPGKPTDPGFDLSAYLGAQGVALSSTTISEWYMTWGWIAVFFGGWIYGKLANSLNFLLESGYTRSNPLMYAYGIMVLFAGIRSLQDLVIMSYGLLAWIGIRSLPIFKRLPQIEMPKQAKRE